MSCLGVLAAIPLGIIFGFQYALISLAAAILFGTLMLFIKRKSEPVVRKTDFMNTDDENEAIRQEVQADGCNAKNDEK